MLIAAITETEALGRILPLASVLPFALLLGSIALFPLFAPHWWEHNKNRALVAGLLAIPFAFWLLRAYGDAAHHALHEALLDYVSFLALLGSLYVISGGIHIKGSLAGSPLSNCGLLAIGAVLANFIGTTGASMVLIRPLLRANESRRKRAHLVVFFIFVVSNCGGLLTPLGDPPLFLGFLKGVPFAWTLSLWKEWALVNGILLVLFYFVDGFVLDREELERKGPQLETLLHHAPFRIEGMQNLVFLLGVVLVIIAKGGGWFSASGHWPFGVQEGLMLALTLASWFGTSRAVHKSNRFHFAPIVEVAILFLGIFVTMVAPLQILNARGSELGVTEPWQYFWATGLLSSFLDNAPTYLTLGATAAGQLGASVEHPHYLGELLAQGPVAAEILAAISCGAVFMGAMTYIGNGPNFMVKAIAESSGVKMPSFFHYMIWSVAILIPTFVAVTFIVFR
ncbi:MAG: sodium:proton antiporter [Planctomycetes bacterium]|nr:sodium:proton antiporter [Planctomycetota bacterium]